MRQKAKARHSSKIELSVIEEAPLPSTLKLLSKGFILPFLLTTLLTAYFTAVANAAPSQRGFQLPLTALTSDSIDDLVDNWKVNVIRVQVGDNANMDGKVGADYTTMMEQQFTLLDQKLPLLEARGLKMIFCLYSPPGGFETRSAPSHYLMFSQPSLQDDFINIWRTIATRYGTSNTIIAFDLSNEPAQRKGMLAAGARPWGKLANDTIAAIRQIQPTTPIIVRSVYGDPSRLNNLVASNDPNVMYSYNAYIWPKYQNQAIETPPFSVQRPSDSNILFGIRKRIAPFYKNIWNLVQDKKLPPSAYPPKMVVGEIAVSGCALEGGQFLNGVLTALETDDSAKSIAAKNRAITQWQRKRRRFRFAKKPVFELNDFLKDVAHVNYAIHSYGEEGAPIWDPRYVCASDGSFSLSPTDTDRGLTLKSFFSFNRPIN